MRSESWARKSAAAALYGGGGVGTLAAGLYALLMAQSLVARRAIGITDARPPSGDGVYGPDYAGEPLSVLILGDSAAVGYGMDLADDTPAGLVGRGLSHVLDRQVEITSHARVGAQTRELAAQIDVGLQSDPDVVLIIIGTNDVTHNVLPAESARQLYTAVRRLRDAGCDVVVGTCPDLGTIKPLPQPLRFIARGWSRRLASRQAVATLKAGGRVVSLADLLGETFSLKADIMFGTDRFHPSSTGYANMVSVVIPALAAAVRDDRIATAYPDQPRDMMTVGDAANEAAQHGGTELVRTGRWAAIRKRRTG